MYLSAAHLGGDAAARSAMLKMANKTARKEDIIWSLKREGYEVT